MDPLVLILIGSGVGAATGLLPGVHVNTLAAIGLAVAPTAGLDAVILLLSVGTVHTIVNIIPGTFLGVPEDDGISMLPAHQLLMQGRSAEAIQTSVGSSLGALLVAIVLSGPWLLALTHLLPTMEAVAPFVAAAVLFALWAMEGRRGFRFGFLAAAVGSAAMLLGWLSTMAAMRPWVQIPATPLLPLLGGLFGGAGLTFAMQGQRIIPTQMEGRRSRRRGGMMMAGTLLASVTAVMPGLTSAVAASFVPGARHHPLKAVAALSAVNTAHAVFAIAFWLGFGTIRTGLADAASRWHPAAWTGISPSPDASVLLATVMFAGALGATITLALGRAAGRIASRVPSRGLAAAAFAFLTSTVLVLAGIPGLALFALATLVGRIPLHFGVRRVHLVAALVGPIIWSAW